MAENKYRSDTAANVAVASYGGVNIDATSNAVVYHAGVSGTNSSTNKYFPSIRGFVSIYSDNSTKVTTGGTQVGSSLVSEGGFGSPDPWTTGSGWSIGSGVATCDGTQVSDTNLSQDIQLEDGKTYSVTFTVSSYTAGTVTPFIGDNSGTARSANGTFTETIVADGNSFGLRGNSSFDATVDDVSVGEVLSSELLEGESGEAFGAMEITGTILLGGLHKRVVIAAGMGRLYAG